MEPLALAAYSGATAVIFHYLNAVQPEPYMDEIFHIPQAQKYCQGNFREVSNRSSSPPVRSLIIISYFFFSSSGTPS